MTPTPVLVGYFTVDFLNFGAFSIDPNGPPLSVDCTFDQGGHSLNQLTALCCVKITRNDPDAGPLYALCGRIHLPPTFQGGHSLNPAFHARFQSNERRLRFDILWYICLISEH